LPFAWRAEDCHGRLLRGRRLSPVLREHPPTPPAAGCRSLTWSRYSLHCVCLQCAIPPQAPRTGSHGPGGNVRQPAALNRRSDGIGRRSRTSLRLCWPCCQRVRRRTVTSSSCPSVARAADMPQPHRFCWTDCW